MIINMASTSAYDENEVQLEVVAEKGEIIKIGDIITIPIMRKNCSTMVYKNNRCEYSK